MKDELMGIIFPLLIVFGLTFLIFSIYNFVETKSYENYVDNHIKYGTFVSCPPSSYKINALSEEYRQKFVEICRGK